MFFWLSKIINKSIGKNDVYSFPFVSGAWSVYKIVKSCYYSRYMNSFWGPPGPCLLSSFHRSRNFVVCWFFVCLWTCVIKLFCDNRNKKTCSPLNANKTMTVVDILCNRPRRWTLLMFWSYEGGFAVFRSIKTFPWSFF